LNFPNVVFLSLVALLLLLPIQFEEWWPIRGSAGRSGALTPPKWLVPGHLFA